MGVLPDLGTDKPGGVAGEADFGGEGEEVVVPHERYEQVSKTAVGRLEGKSHLWTLQGNNCRGRWLIHELLPRKAS